ncbi:group III truncated hemoglobin [Xanthobacteraceae bacterium A53D]
MTNARHTEINEATISDLVEVFYARIRAHAQLGPVFEAAVHDWPEHLKTLKAFWSSIMLRSGRYKGNPLAVHRPMPLEAGQFTLWLGVWQQTTADLFAPELAAQFNDRANRIADSLKAGLLFDPRKVG